MGFALLCSSRMTVLRLQENGIGPVGVRALAVALSGHGTLRSLILGGNTRCGDEGATALAAALERNTVLTELNINNCGVALGGAKALAAALGSNGQTALKTLSAKKNFGGGDLEEVRALLARDSLKVMLE